MPDIKASLAGTFHVGGELPIHRLGFGAMRITGAGIWGAPADRAEALRVLRRLPELGVNFIGFHRREFGRWQVTCAAVRCPTPTRFQPKGRLDELAKDDSLIAI